MAGGEFDFGGFVSARGKRAPAAGHADYAYEGDRATLRRLSKMPPVTLAAAAVVRMYKRFLKNQYLGTTVRVSERQFPRIHAIAVRCAERLGVPVPTVYVQNSPFLNAYTFGTQEDSFIVVHSALIDHFTEAELCFVLGHETGHIHNQHVVYGTLLHVLRTTASLLVRWISPPLEVALLSWYRQAEVTCDRAGLLCCGDLSVATKSFLKMATGSQKLYAELDVDAYLTQLEESRRGLGRLTEAFASHPYLPKRVAALRAFSESALCRRALGLGDGGLTMDEVDTRTREILQILKDPAAPSPESSHPPAEADHDRRE